MSPARHYSLGTSLAPRASADFIAWLVGRHPPLAAVLKEHLTDNDGELLPLLIWVSFVESAQGVPGDAEEPLRERLRPFPKPKHALSHYE